MGVAELMSEIRKLPEDELLRLAAEVDEEAARLVDRRFEERISNGDFDALAAEALREDGEGKTVALDEVLGQRELP